MEPDVALPVVEPVLPRKRDIPSAGMEGSAAMLELWEWLKAGEPLEPFGVMVAEMVDSLASALWWLRLRRRFDTSSPSRSREYLEPFLLFSFVRSTKAEGFVGGDWGGEFGRIGGDRSGGSSGEGGSSNGEIFRPTKL